MTTTKDLIVETEDGEQFIADIKDFEVEIETTDRGMGIMHEQYTFEVGTLINTETSEEH